MLTCRSNIVDSIPYLLLSVLLVVACEDDATVEMGESGGVSVAMPTTNQPMGQGGGTMTAGEQMLEGGESTPIAMGGAMWDQGGEQSSTEDLEGGASVDEGGSDFVRPPICMNPPTPSIQGELAMEARCRSVGEPLKVRHIRDPRCPEYIEGPTRQPGVEVSLANLVVTGVFGDKFSVQDEEGGVYSGLWVYSRSTRDLSFLQPGTRVDLDGQIIEFFTVTELVVETDGIEVVGNGAIPEPFYVADTAMIANDGAWVEQLESMLLKVEAARVSNTAPDCPMDQGMFIVNNDLRIDRFLPGDVIYEPSRGDILSEAVGVLHFSFDHQKLLPRTLNDLNSIGCGGIQDKCDAAECPAEPNDLETGELIITEIQNNPRGEDDLREYIELYNPNATPVDTTGWWIQDCAGYRAELGGQVDGRGYLVIAGSTQRNQNGGVNAQSELGDLFLPNGDGEIFVFNGNGILVDQVRYEPGSGGWPDRSPGNSLELVEPAADNRSGSAWTEANRSYGEGGQGSPGAAYR